MRSLIIACLILTGCKDLDSDFVKQCEKNQSAQKVAVQQSGLGGGMTSALLDYDCKELVSRYGASCKEQVKEVVADQRDRFYSSCIISEHAKAASAKLISDILNR